MANKKPKKSPQQRQEIRAEGKIQAQRGKEELKALRQKGFDHVLAGTISGGVAGAGKALSNKFPGDIGPKTLAGAIRGAKTSLGQHMQENADKIGKAKAKVWQGTFRGIFNHPDWYKYDGVLNIPPMNPNRPMNPRALKHFTSKLTVGSVPHVVHVHAKWVSPLTTEAFKLASIEAFKEIRLNLKSNLPYAQADYDDYIDTVVSLLLIGKVIERTLGWANVTRADIPELQDALDNVSKNPLEQGVVSTIKIGILNNYAESVNLYKKLQSILQMLYIPTKYQDFINWLVGSVFVDQAAPNPQIYMTMMREMPLYTFSYDASTKSYAKAQAKTVDIVDLSIQEVIDSAILFLNVYGIMNADIGKTGNYVPIKLADVEAGSYTPNYLNDPEYFNILINAYACSGAELSSVTQQNSEYVRVDFTSEMGQENTVGVLNALGSVTLTSSTTPFKIISQSAFVAVDSDIEVPVAGILSGSTQYRMGKYPAPGVVVQYTTLSQFEINTEVSTGTVAAVINPSQSNKFSLSIFPASKVIDRLAISTYDHDIVMYGTHKFLDLDGWYSHSSGNLITTSWGFFRLQFEFTTVASVKTLTGARIWRHDTIGDTYITLDISTFVFTYQKSTGTYSVRIPANTMIWDDTTTPIATTGPEWSIFAHAFQIGMNNSISLGGAQILAVGIMEYSYSAADTMITSVNMSEALFHWFIENVDYHLPMVYSTKVNTKVTVAGTPDTVLETSSTTLPVLVKECYIPVILAKLDLDTSLYWMYLGLFSLR